MSVVDARNNPKEERGRENEGYVGDESSLPSFSQEQANDSEIPKQSHTLEHNSEMPGNQGVQEDKVPARSGRSTGSQGPPHTPNTREQKGFHCQDIFAIVFSLFFCFLGCLNYISSIVIEVLCMWDLNTSGKSMANAATRMPTTSQTWPMMNDTFDPNETWSVTTDTFDPSESWYVLSDTVDAVNNTRSVMTCDPEKSQEDIPYDLIDFVLYIQPVVVILFWKCKFAKHIDEYEGGNGTDRKEKMSRLRRTCYFIALNMLFFFLFHCVECTTCSFLNPNVFFGTAIEIVYKPYCPFINTAFQLALVPAYSLCCWYATKMACVLRRRAKKIQEKSKTLFGTDNKTKDPRAILKELEKELLYDSWGEEVWKNISFVMNIKVYIAVILVLLYTHVHISHVKLTLGQWFSHFMRVLTIASLALTPYMHVAFACVRVTEALKKMSEKSRQAERNDNETFESANSNSTSSTESQDVAHIDRWEKIAFDITKLERHTQLSERRAQWARLLKEISKCQDTALYNGKLSSLYTTRNGVHWTMLAMVGAVAWEVLDHLNAFAESKDSDTSKNRFIVTLFGALALLVGISAVFLVLFWKICGLSNMFKMRYRKLPIRKSTNTLRKLLFMAYTIFVLNSTNTLTKLLFMACTIFVLSGIIYACFYLVVYEDRYCKLELNPLVT